MLLAFSGEFNYFVVELWSVSMCFGLLFIVDSLMSSRLASYVTESCFYIPNCRSAESVSQMSTVARIADGADDVTCHLSLY